MRKLIALFLLTGICLLSIGQNKGYYPEPHGFINDFERDFSKPEKSDLDNTVKNLLISAMEVEVYKGMEIAIVTVTDSMFGDEKSLQDYAIKLATKWGLGSKKNNGILIALSSKLRAVSITTGNGMDPLLPNEICQKIVDEKMLPELRKARYYTAVLLALDGIKTTLGIK